MNTVTPSVIGIARVDRIVHAVAGTLVLASVALTHYHSPNWIWLTLFVGANLLQSGLSNWCLMSRLLAMAGVTGRAACGLPAGR